VANEREDGRGQPTSEASENPRFTRGWQNVCGAILLAHAQKRRRWRRRIDRLWDEDWRLHTVLTGIVLEFLVLEKAGPAPSSQDISQLARRIQNPFLRLCGGEVTLLINVIHTVFDRALPDQFAEPGELLLYASAAAGLLLEEPAAELPVLRPKIYEFWASTVPSLEEELRQSQQD
jgi:hypothetical protein